MSLVLPLGTLSFPASPEALFGRSAPLALEIGHGDGRFTAGLARRHPEWNVLGVELAPTSVSRAYRRMRREGIAHVRLLQGDARFVVRNVVPPASLHRVYVNFPDPWPKERHHDRRLLQASFFDLLSTRLAPDGALLFTSDHEEYFAFALAQARATGRYAIDERPTPPEMLETKYALRWREQQKTIQHAVFRATAPAEADYPPTIQRVPMHHALLEGDLDGITTFEKDVRAFDGGQVILLDLSRTLDGARLHFQVLVEEEGLKQEVLVEARPSTHGVFVGLKRFGSPVITPGVREAVRCVAAWLEARGLRLIQEAA